MALLSSVHKQIQANKLRELFSSSPLLLVYQTLGNVRSAQLVDDMQSMLDKQASGSGIRANSFKIKNTIVASAKGSPLTPFFQANNILVGWSVPINQPRLQFQAKRGDTLQSILGDLVAGQGPSPPKIPQKTLSTLIELSLNLPTKMPVALLAGFYNGQHVKLAHLKEWMALNEAQVYGELLAQIEGAPAELCNLDAHLEQLVDTVDAIQPFDILACLDAKAVEQAATPPTSG
mmetsp:Transcript_26923/g.58793  ORF Transcript_26923/g.58793 Transcript_26923/m.58793 type:complete len:233 (+) Transcript_26923:75-773(+)|eukprot:CAMPEP_0202893208 /NCGR_PEP_ID=MMETSP1392-20130828/2831_1 /ASSEMBLY_ACC=CAM_ASM_000868 /TAXON_ID=225041 /ORGANISM="Chlamydomonas chlamydogama, Strain SAG 11-48b" /LENGTH=232 /DNA_ID=CAMNT_0049577461 /DNA_START=38 /DNA_END=736 /DNA_ORIENTATION=-